MHSGDEIRGPCAVVTSCTLLSGRDVATSCASKSIWSFRSRAVSVVVQCCIVLLLARALNVLVSSLYLPPFVQPLSNKVGSVVSFMIVRHKLFAQTWRWRVASRAGVSNAVWRRAKRLLILIGLSRLSHGATGRNVQQSVTAAIAGSTRCDLMGTRSTLDS